MKTIIKYCKSLKSAESYQNRLYNKYNYVKLIGFPDTYSGYGNYTWIVNN